MSMEVQGNTVNVNGEVIPVVKNPKYRDGKPTIVTRVARVGSNTQNTQSEDFSEAYSVVTLTIANTVDNIRKKEQWQENLGKNAIRIMDETTGFIKTFSQCSVANDPEHELGEELEIEFHGNSAV